jgi:transposase
MKMSIGVDLHKTQFTVCFLSEDRTIKENGFYPTTDKGYEAFLEKAMSYESHGFELSAAVESTGNTRYFRNRLLVKGINVVVVNTVKFKVVNESVKKTDKHDARTLAEFLEKDMLPESVLCSQESEDLRRVLKSRSILVQSIVSIKNQVHGALLGYGIETKRGQLQSRKERRRILNGLADHEVNGHAAKAIEPLLDTIDQLYVQVKNLEKLLESMTREDKDVALLQTIPGVGIITAATIRAYTDDIRRYDSSKKYASYIGIAPWVQNSNETIHHGHITKRGPIELRTAMVQCVMGMVRSSKITAGYRIMTKYRAMKQVKGSGQSIIASARKMSTIIYQILTTGEPFDPSKMTSQKKYKDMQSAALNAERAG